jgi:hypothetical protein
MKSTYNSWKSLVLLGIVLGLAFSVHAGTDQVDEPDELDKIGLLLDKMKVSMQDTKAHVQKITEQVKGSRTYLNTLAVSPLEMAGKDIQTGSSAALDLSYEDWSGLISGRKAEISQVLLKDSVIRENLAEVNFQIKAVQLELKQLQSLGDEFSKHFSEISENAKGVKKTFRNAYRIPGLFIKVKSVGGELNGMDTLMTSAAGESGLLLKQMATLISVIPEAAPSQEMMAKVEAAHPVEAVAEAAPTVAGPVVAKAAPVALTASVIPAVRTSPQPQVINGLWSGEVTHLASGSLVKVLVSVGSPRVGQIVGYMMIPVRDEQGTLILKQVATGTYLLEEGAESKNAKRKVQLAGTNLAAGRMEIAIISTDGVSEFQGELVRN